MIITGFNSSLLKALPSTFFSTKSMLNLLASIGLSIALIGCSTGQLESVHKRSLYAQKEGEILPEKLNNTMKCCDCDECSEQDDCVRLTPTPLGPHPGRNGMLTPAEMRLARIAWKYFENNYQESTGLVNAVNNYPSTTMWDTGSYLGGLTAALELGLICRSEFDKRITTLMKTLNTMDFFRGELPNKVYNTQTAQKADYANNPGEIGYSALDLGRLLIWLKIIKGRYPEYGDSIDNAVLRWDFCNVLDSCGTMYGALLDKNNEIVYVQEGRLGYEEYAAKGFQMWGFDTRRSSLNEPYDFIPIYDVMVPYDSRDPRKLTAHNYVVCESYILDGIELNWDLVGDTDSDDMHHSEPLLAEYAQRIYTVQERRYEHTGILTARTEHQLDGPPYFVYDTIFSDGFPWITITESGENVPDFAAIALKGAFGLWVLWDTDYTDLLYNAIAGLNNPESGFYEGRYEKSGGTINTFTANNNGIILETLLYKVEGKLHRVPSGAGRWESVTTDEFNDDDKCYPGHDKHCGSASRGHK